MVDFDDVESVIGNPYAFKQKLGIGEDAFDSLRQKKKLGKIFDFADTAGAAATGVGVASSTAVASTFFAPSGLLSIIGLGAAVTPIGWVIAAGAASSLAYVGIKRYMTSGKDDKVDVIPKWINTPMDVLAVGLFDFLAPLGLKVAMADGTIGVEERDFIYSHFVYGWGYSPKFYHSAIKDTEENLEKYEIITLTENLIKYKKENPDCNYGFMATELKTFLNGVMIADGKIDDREAVTFKAIESILDSEKPTFTKEITSQARGFWTSLSDRVRTMSK